MKALSVRTLDVDKLGAMERRLKAEREAQDRTYIAMGRKVLGMVHLAIDDLFADDSGKSSELANAFKEIFDGYADCGFDEIEAECKSRGIEITFGGEWK